MVEIIRISLLILSPVFELLRKLFLFIVNFVSIEIDYQLLEMLSNIILEGDFKLFFYLTGLLILLFELLRLVCVYLKLYKLKLFFVFLYLFLKKTAYFFFWEAQLHLYENLMRIVIYVPRDYEDRIEEEGRPLLIIFRYIVLLYHFFPRFLVILWYRLLWFLFPKMILNEIIIFFFTLIYFFNINFKEAFASLVNLRTSAEVFYTSPASWRIREDVFLGAFWSLMDIMHNKLIFVSSIYVYIKRAFLLIVSLAYLILFSIFYLIFSLIPLNKIALALNLIIHWTNYDLRHLINYYVNYVIRKSFWIFEKFLFVFGFFIVVLFEIIYVLSRLFLKLFILMIRFSIIFMFIFILYYFFNFDIFLPYYFVDFVKYYILQLHIFTDPIYFFINYLDLKPVSLAKAHFGGKSLFLSYHTPIGYYEKQSVRWQTLNLWWAQDIWILRWKFTIKKFIYYKIYHYIAILCSIRFWIVRLLMWDFIHFFYLHKHFYLYIFLNIFVTIEHIIIDLPITWCMFLLFYVFANVYDFSGLIDILFYLVPIILGYLKIFVSFTLEILYLVSLLLIEFIGFVKLYYFTGSLYAWLVAFVFNMSVVEWILYFDVWVKVGYYFVNYIILYLILQFEFPILNLYYDDFCYILAGNTVDKTYLIVVSIFFDILSESIFFFSDFFLLHFDFDLSKILDFNYYYHNSYRILRISKQYRTYNNLNYFDLFNFNFFNYYYTFYYTSDALIKNFAYPSIIEYVLLLFLVYLFCNVFFRKSFRALALSYRKNTYYFEYVWRSFLNNVNNEDNWWITVSLPEYMLFQYYRTMEPGMFSKHKKEFKTWPKFKRILLERMEYANSLGIEQRHNYLKQNVFPYVQDLLKTDDLKKEFSKIWDYDYHSFLKVRNHRGINELFFKDMKNYCSFLKNIETDFATTLSFYIPYVYNIDLQGAYHAESISNMNDKLNKFFYFIDKRSFCEFSPFWMFGIDSTNTPIIQVEKGGSDIWCFTENENESFWDFFQFFIACIIILISCFYQKFGYPNNIINIIFFQEYFIWDMLFDEVPIFRFLSENFIGNYNMIYGGSNDSIPTSNDFVVLRYSLGRGLRSFVISEEMILKNNFYARIDGFLGFVIYNLINIFGFNIEIYLVFFPLYIKYNKYFFKKDQRDSLKDCLNMWFLVKLKKNFRSFIFARRS